MERCRRERHGFVRTRGRSRRQGRYGSGTEILLESVMRSSRRSSTIDVLLSGAVEPADVDAEGAFQREESEFARVCDKQSRATGRLRIAILRYSSRLPGV